MGNEENKFTDAQLLRMRAEEQLRARKEAGMPGQEIDMQRLIHELQVHQIELEMQNEELRQANETAETALGKYTMLYDLAPIAYFTLTSEGTICEANFTGADLLGERRISLINKNFKLFVSEYSRPVFNDFFAEILGGNGKASCEVRLCHHDNPLCFAYILGKAVGDDRKCLLSVVDISKRKTADQ